MMMMRFSINVLLLTMVALVSVTLAGTCAPENYNKQFTMGQGEGGPKCTEEIGAADAPCFTTCLICYTNCRGISEVSTFIVDDLGSTLCLCSAAMKGAQYSATIILSSIIMAAINSRL